MPIFTYNPYINRYLLRCPVCDGYRIAEIKQVTAAFMVDVWQVFQPDGEHPVEIIPDNYSSNGPNILNAEPIEGPRYKCMTCHAQFDAFFSDGSYQLPDGEVVDA